MFMSSQRALVILIIAITTRVIINLRIPSPLEPAPWPEAPSLREMLGTLQPNDALENCDILLRNLVMGAEAFAMRTDGKVYTGTADGLVVLLDSSGEDYEVVWARDIESGTNVDMIEGKREIRDRMSCSKTVAGRNGKPISEEAERICGRPLGLEYTKKGQLYILDAYHGLYIMDSKSRKVTHLLDSNTAMPTAPASATSIDPVALLRMRFLNDLTIAPGGSIYITDSSFKHARHHNRLEILDAAPRGRLLRYDTATKELTTVLCGLHFPNGIHVAPDGKSLLVVESMRFRILKVPLNTNFSLESCNGTVLPQGVTVWLDHLVGFCDNIMADTRPKSDAKYLLACGTKISKPFSALGLMFKLPVPVRRVIGQLLNMEFIETLVPKYGLVLELSETGEIVGSMHDATQRIPFISTAMYNPVSKKLFLGSSQNPFLATVDM